MSRNEITLQEMFSSVIGEQSGRWGKAHIYQCECIQYSPNSTDAHAQAEPDRTEEIENFLRQRNCSWNTVSTYIKAMIRFTTGQWTESWCDMYPDCLNMYIPVHTDR